LILQQKRQKIIASRWLVPLFIDNGFYANKNLLAL
jgi:hypothetical protein